MGYKNKIDFNINIIYYSLEKLSLILILCRLLLVFQVDNYIG